MTSRRIPTSAAVRTRQYLISHLCNFWRNAFLTSYQGGASTPPSSVEDDLDCPAPCRHHPLYSKCPDGLGDQPHLSGLGKFVTDVSKAVRNSFPRKPRQYDRGHAIFLRWKEDDIRGTVDQIRVLRDHFERLRFTVDPSAFTTSEYLLEPVGDNRPDNVFSKLQLELLRYRDEFGRLSDSVLIIYYGGHGKMVRLNCMWYAHAPFADSEREGRTLNWTQLAGQLVPGDGNILFIIDSCSAVGMGIREGSGGIKELLAACGKTESTSAEESNAFTNSINQELDILQQSRSQINIAALHSRLVDLHSDRLLATPQRIPLSNQATTDSIILNYGDDGGANIVPPAPEADGGDLVDKTRVLVAIRLQNPAIAPRVDDWATWIRSFAPAGIAGIDVDLACVHPVSLHQSKSTLLVASLPLSVWNLMPHRPGCTFIDLVQSDNLLSLKRPQEPQVSEVKPVSASHLMTQIMKESNPSAKPVKGDDGVRTFACPFYRHSPLSHPECGTLRIRHIKDVKEHLKMRHAQPLYCTICGRHDFGDQKALDNHVLARVCKGLGGFTSEGLDVNQLSQLSRRSHRHLNATEQWMEIWDVVFPGTSRPQSPFSKGNYFDESVDIIAGHWEVNGRALLSEALEIHLGDHQHDLYFRQAATQMASAVVRRLLDGVLAMNATAKQGTTVRAYQKVNRSPGLFEFSPRGDNPSLGADKAIYPTEMDLDNQVSESDGPEFEPGPSVRHHRR